MAALTGELNNLPMGQGMPLKMSYPVKTGVTIYKGAIVVIDSSGYAKPGVSETSDLCVGRACQTVVAGAAASGTFTIQAEQGVFKYKVNGTAVTIADMGTLCYVYDDQTVTKSSASASIAGTVYGLDAAGDAYVYMSLDAPIDSSAVTTISNTVSTLKTNLMVPWTCPVILATAVTGATVATVVPGMSGTIFGLEATVIAAATTTDKAATLTAKIGGVAVTGGLLALTFTLCKTLGNRVAATAITAANTITAASSVTVTVVTGKADFAEGQVLLTMFLQST